MVKEPKTKPPPPSASTAPTHPFTGAAAVQQNQQEDNGNYSNGDGNSEAAAVAENGAGDGEEAVCDGANGELLTDEEVEGDECSSMATDAAYKYAIEDVSRPPSVVENVNGISGIEASNAADDEEVDVSSSLGICLATNEQSTQTDDDDENISDCSSSHSIRYVAVNDANNNKADTDTDTEVIDAMIECIDCCSEKKLTADDCEKKTGNTSAIPVIGNVDEVIDSTCGEVIDNTCSKVIENICGEVIDNTSDKVIDNTCGEVIKNTSNVVIENTCGKVIDSECGEVIEKPITDIEEIFVAVTDANFQLSLNDNNQNYRKSSSEVIGDNSELIIECNGIDNVFDSCILQPVASRDSNGNGNERSISGKDSSQSIDNQSNYTGNEDSNLTAFIEEISQDISGCDNIENAKQSEKIDNQVIDNDSQNLCMDLKVINDLNRISKSDGDGNQFTKDENILAIGIDNCCKREQIDNDNQKLENSSDNICVLPVDNVVSVEIANVKSFEVIEADDDDETYCVGGQYYGIEDIDILPDSDNQPIAVIPSRVNSVIQNCDSECDYSDDDDDADSDGEKVAVDDGANDPSSSSSVQSGAFDDSGGGGGYHGVIIEEVLENIAQDYPSTEPPQLASSSGIFPDAMVSDVAYDAHLHLHQYQQLQQFQHHQYHQQLLHHQAATSSGLLQPLHSASGTHHHQHHHHQHNQLAHQHQQISSTHQHQHQPHCAHHHHHLHNPPGLPHIHVHHPSSLGHSHVNASTSSTTTSANGHGHAHLFPVQVISAAAVAAAAGGAWPLVEAPIYIDANGEYRTFCPAHSHQGPAPAAALPSAGAGVGIGVGVGVSSDGGVAAAAALTTTAGGEGGALHQSLEHHVMLTLDAGVSLPLPIASKRKVLRGGPTTVQMVSQNLPPPMPVPVQVPQGQVMQQYVNESGTLTHVVLSPQQYQQLHTGQGHIHAPFLTANGTSHFYSPLSAAFPPGPGGGPPHYHPMTGGHLQPQPPPQQMSHSPHSPSPPNNYHKDERTQRQHTKLLRKLDQKREMNSAKSTPAHSPSPRKNDLNGHHNSHNNHNSSNHIATGTTTTTNSHSGHNHNHYNNNHNHSRRNASRNGGGGSVGGGGSSSGGGGASSVGTSEDGEDPSSVVEDEDDFQTVTEQLSAIQKPEVIDVTSRSAKIIWEGPAITDSLINIRNLRYNVLLSDRAKECKYKSLYKGESYDCIVQDLQPGQEYVVRLQVHYEKLQGSASEPTEFTTPPCEPNQPIPPKLIVRTKNSLHLRWTAPYNNGAQIQHYILEYDEGKGSHFVEAAKTKCKQYILTKLSPSTVYNFRLAAVNECGPSMYSGVAQFSTSGNPPSAPKPPTVQTTTSTMLRLAWERRTQDGEFVLQMLDRDSGHGFLNMYNGVETIYECCGLRRATSYQFRLRADNEAGSSAWSNEVTYKTNPERPGRPSKPQVKGKIHGTHFKAKWDPPNDRGGVDITRYFLEICSGPKFERIYSGSEAEAVCDRLQPGTTYQIRAACEGPGGQSGYSEVCTVTTEAIVPGTPEPPFCDNPPGPYAAVLRFDKPDYNGGAPILEFEVQLMATESDAGDNADDDSEIIYRGRDSYCVAQDLTPGCAYEAMVRAINRIGAGQWSAKYKFAAAAAAPFTPDPPAVFVKSPTHLTVSWKEPYCNGAPISEYRLESSYLSADADEVTTTSSSMTSTSTPLTTKSESSEFCPTDFSTCYHGLNTSTDVRNLLPFTYYYFRVNASNSAGSSKFSPVVSTQTPAAVPLAPHFKGYEFTSNEVLLKWCEPDNNGSEIHSYNIEYADRSITTEDNSNEYTITGLTPETNYKFRVQAVNGIGASPFSSYVKLTTLPPPPKPPVLDCTGVGHNFIKLKWAGGKNLDFTKYYVEMYVNRAKEFQVVYSGTNSMCKVNKLQEQTAYTFRICAGNDISGIGEYSQEYVFTTTATLPSSIKVPRVAFEGGVCIIGHGGNSTNNNSNNNGNSVPSGLIPEAQSFNAGLAGLTIGIPLTLEWQHSKNSFNDPVEYALQYAIGKDADFKQIYRGPETKFTIENLEPGAFYLFRVCPIRVTSSVDLPGQFTSPLRYHVPPLSSIDCIDGSQQSGGDVNGGVSSASGNHRGNSNGSFSHHSHGHHHPHHQHSQAHSHNHHSRHNGGGGGSGVSTAHHRSVSASAAAAAAASNNNQNGSCATNVIGGGHSSMGLHSVVGNAIGLIPLSAASDLASFAAAGCDDQLLLKVAAAAAAAAANTTNSIHSTNVTANVAVANSTNTTGVVASGGGGGAGGMLSNNFNAAANTGAIRRFTGKLTALYTNRKRFTDQEKAVIIMVSFLFLAILFAALVKMFTS